MIPVMLSELADLFQLEANGVEDGRLRPTMPQAKRRTEAAWLRRASANIAAWAARRAAIEAPAKP